MKKTIGSLSAITALFVAMSGTAFASHNPAVVSFETGACGETTFTASITDPLGTHKVANMYLVVSADGSTQNVNIPTDGTEVSIDVGPFTTDETISWRVFGGGERDYDMPLWDGYGEAGFSADIATYAAGVGGYDWVLSGPEDANPFTTWNEVSVIGCPPPGAIVSPTAGEEITKGDTLNLEAHDVGAKNGGVQWAIRKGSTCTAGINTVAGNVDGFSDSYAWVDGVFTSSISTSGLDLGVHCFIFNPTQGDRLTRLFEIVEPAADPTAKEQCMKGGWEDLGFKNQGQCIRFVETGKDSR